MDAGEGKLVGVGLARAHHREVHGGSRLALEHEADHGQRQLAGGLLADGLDDVAVGQVLLVGGRAGRHADHGGVAEALGNQDAHLGDAGGGTVLVDFVFRRGEIAGVGIQRFQQAVESAAGDLVHIGLGNVVGLDSPQHVAVDADLAVGAILHAAGLNAQQPELAQAIAKGEGGQDCDGKHEYKTLQESGHTHHRGGHWGIRPLTL